MIWPAAGETGPTRRGAVASIVVSAVGAGLIAIALGADLLARHSNHEFGTRQRLTLLTGAGVLLTGVLLWPALRTLRRAVLPWLAALVVAACAAVVSTSHWHWHSNWVLLGYLLAACLLLPRGFGAMSFVGTVCVVGALSAINAAKTDLTGLPLTMFDLRIAISDPTGLWNAVKLPTWTLYTTVCFLAIVILWWSITAVTALKRLYTRRRDRRSMLSAGARLLGVTLLAAVSYLYLQSFYELARTDDDTWEPAGVSDLANWMGIVPFLGYSYKLESAATGDFYAQSPGTTAPDGHEIREAVLKFASFDGSASVRPNIMMVLAESTFDPGAIFRIQGSWNHSLFEPTEHTAAVGPFRVNAVGGGTWITEFETLVGIDARVFGYSGYYTHAAVAPFVTRSLASHLRDRGYRTTVFMPTDGGFFNARHAYEKYGFETILDSRDLGRFGPRDWFSSDVEVAGLVKNRLGSQPPQPFFVYVLLIENHFPHDCKLASTYRFTTKFVETDEFEPNCSLHEYLRRLDATSAAVAMLRDYLQAIQLDTGRPYVLSVFGDHQPVTFTGSPRYHYDVTPYRRGANLNQTFFRIEASAQPGLHCCREPLPASALPALVSTFAADRPDDVYLGVTLWLFERCGSDAVHRKFAKYLGEMSDDGTLLRTRECQDAYERTLAWYRSAGIVRTEAAEPDG